MAASPSQSALLGALGGFHIVLIGEVRARETVYSMVVRSKDLRTRVFKFKSVLLLPIP